MIYLFILIILMSGYYSLTYGISLWRDDKNKLAGFGAITITLVGTIAPIILLYIKR